MVRYCLGTMPDADASVQLPGSVEEDQSVFASYWSADQARNRVPPSELDEGVPILRPGAVASVADYYILRGTHAHSFLAGRRRSCR